MKVFLSYRFTGEDPKELETILSNVCRSIEGANHTHFCSFWSEDLFRKNNYSNKKILEYAFDELDTSDIYLALVKSEDKSEGMLIEAGFAKARNKKIYVAIKKGIKTTFLREMADKVIEYGTYDELYSKLSVLS